MIYVDLFSAHSVTVQTDLGPHFMSDASTHMNDCLQAHCPLPKCSIFCPCCL